MRRATFNFGTTSIFLTVLFTLSPDIVAAQGRKHTRDDAILHWNAIALQVVVDDHSGTYGFPENGGPTRTSRALAIVHIAMYDALNAIDGSCEPYIPVRCYTAGASIDAAVAQAARDTLVALYPSQQKALDRELKQALKYITKKRERDAGVTVGKTAATNILLKRSNDGSALGDLPIHPGTSTPPYAGEHLPDPINPSQGLLTQGWGQVDTFSRIDVTTYGVRTPPPPALTDSAYTDAFFDVLAIGGDGIGTFTLRTQKETEMGLFWAYDGSKDIGVPPVLYNQIARKIAKQQRNTVVQNARLFALVNISMGDAGIAAWDSKYYYNYWRPIVAIRNADSDGNPDTDEFYDEDWTPMGAPVSNQIGNNFTPPFPAYPSGHATFGAAMFHTLEKFYGRDKIAYWLTSDELNPSTTDNQGNPRPYVIRRFKSFSEGAIENGRSRIYLGIHWQFDADAGIEQGQIVADYACKKLLLPKKWVSKKSSNQSPGRLQ